MKPVMLGPGEGETISDSAERTIRILLDHELADVTWTRYEPGERMDDGGIFTVFRGRAMERVRASGGGNATGRSRGAESQYESSNRGGEE